MMAKSGKTLADLRKTYSDLIFIGEDVPCHWRKKGQVMRNLIEQTVNENRQLIDGVRILRNGSWVLVQPNRKKDLFHIYAEGRNKKTVKALIQEFRKKIGEMQK